MAGASLTECREVAGGLDLLGLMGASVGPVPEGFVRPVSIFELCRRRLCRGILLSGSSPPEKSGGSKGKSSSGPYGLVTIGGAGLRTRGALQALVGFCHSARRGAFVLEAFATLPGGRPSTAGCRRFPTAPG